MKALGALTEGLFDYAGMFPPASLSFNEMLEHAAKLPETLDRPKLVGSDIVVTPQEWPRIEGDVLRQAGFSTSRHVRICLVGVPASDSTKVSNAILEFNREGRLDKVPHDVVALEMHSNVVGLEATAASLMPARFILAASEVQIYWEPKLDDAGWLEKLDDVFAILDACNGESELPIVGLKVRCGGDDAVSAGTLARIVAEVDERVIPFKATQGLHHPLAGMHGNDIGFIGVAVALRMFEEGAMDADQIEACLTETDPTVFGFDEGISWRGHSIDLGQLGHAMKTPFAIGSCSLDEPDAGLAEFWPRIAA